MIPIYPSDTIPLWDQFSLVQLNISSFELLDRAGFAIAQHIRKHLDGNSLVIFIAGKGNNGGDAIRAATYLNKWGYNAVVWSVLPQKKQSPENSKSAYDFRLQCADRWFENVNIEHLTTLPKSTIIIDGILGTGFKGELDEETTNLVKKINSSGLKCWSIDIPTGLLEKSVNREDEVIIAERTFTIESPKISFLFPEFEKYVGEFELVQIGLSKEFIASSPPWAYFIANNERPTLKKRSKFAHKGHFGHLLLYAGSTGKAGAAILAAEAALTIGCGKVTVHTPINCVLPLQICIPEAMVEADSSLNFWSETSSLSKVAIACGPGLGNENESLQALETLLVQQAYPLLLDADALNLLAKNKSLLKMLPANSILTPHALEFDRLTEKHSSFLSRLERVRSFSKNFNVIVVLKNAYTFICCPNGDLYVNGTGSPGMAKAGSGDVLTGMIGGLLAKGLTPLEATLQGVWYHGKAGEIATQKKGQEAVLARDIIRAIPEALSVHF